MPLRRGAHRPVCAIALATSAILASCGDGARRNADPADAGAGRATTRGVAATTAPVAARPTCLGTGHWEPCTIVDRLERAGLVPLGGDSIRRPFLAVAGQTWRLHRGTLHVFRYADSSARVRDLATLDTLRATPRGDTTRSWGDGPVTLLASDNPTTCSRSW
ncbi:MAG: hypothetical protein MUF21_02310 [Gemmatimonadaceae bacterium]|nr:hypothetical protein [Gemmatimonadaceae bacterium]